jgi:homoserine kinase
MAAPARVSAEGQPVRRARAPASSANLGPGFDTLAVALDLYVEVTVGPADRLVVRAEGEGADLPGGPSHLAARVATAVAGHDRLEVAVRSSIPVGRGLGSSAALAAAAAAAAGSSDPLAVAAASDGHPDNAAASVLGGLVGVATIADGPVAVRLPLDPELRFVLVVPDRELPTAEARAVLPAVVAHADAAFNLGRMALLVAGLADHRILRAEATEDRLHQPARARLFPQATALLSCLVDAGALASCWSGAGPSLLGICTAERAPEVQAAARATLDALGVAGRVLLRRADTEGLVVEGESGARARRGGPGAGRGVPRSR